MEKTNFAYSEFRGIVKKVDALGRITIPTTFRQEMGLKNLEKVEVFLTINNEIVIRKYEIEDKP